MIVLLRQYGGVFLKGAAMGAANVVPGVSGGTIAFITGIYERLIEALKSLDWVALRLLAGLRFAQFARHVDFGFLAALGAGVLLSVATLARLLEYLFEQFPVFIWAFFFGLILASVYFVGKMVQRWSAGSLVALLLGAAIAVAIALLTPASENSGFAYLVICGVVAVCSMIVPGLSGSFVLLLMGNYMLVIGSISDVTAALKGFELTAEAIAAVRVMFPVGIGCVAGLVVFSHILAWVFRRHHDLAVALMTGFITGSLIIIWPWKQALFLLDASGQTVLRKGEKVIQGYEWFVPPFETATLVAAAVALVGIAVVVAIEWLGSSEPRPEAGRIAT